MFSIENIKDGMVVELETGDRYLVHDGKLIDTEGWYDDLYGFDSDLNNKLDSQHINKVYSSHALKITDIFKDENLSLVWERQESCDVLTALKAMETSRKVMCILEDEVYDFVGILGDDYEFTLDMLNYGTWYVLD